MRRAYSFQTASVFGCLIAAASCQGQAARETGAFAIVGAKIEVGNGRVLNKGTILLRKGLIEAVGENLTIPPDAEIIKADGMTAYPGFVDAHSTTGLKLPDPQPNQDRPPDTVSLAPAAMREANRKGFRPELRASDALALTDALLMPWRENGFTTAWLAPSGGTINGQGVLVHLSGAPKREAILRTAEGISFAFATPRGDNSGTGYPGSLLGILALTRQTLLDAAHFRVVKSAFQRGSSVRPPSDDVLESLQPLLRGEQPVIYEANSSNEITRARKIAEEFNLRLIVSGGSEAWRQSALLARKGIPVLLSLNFPEEPDPKKPEPAKPTPPTPKAAAGSAAEKAAEEAKKAEEAAAALAKEQDDTPAAARNEYQRKWLEQTANAANLHKAGVLIAFTTRGLKTPSEFGKNLRRVMQAGLSHEAALQALTLNPAKIFGMDRQMGTIEAGKIADIVLMSGDFAEEKSKVKFLLIDRNKFELDRDKEMPPPVPATPPPPSCP